MCCQKNVRERKSKYRERKNRNIGERERDNREEAGGRKKKKQRGVRKETEEMKF